MANKTIETKLKLKVMYDCDAQNPIDKEYDEGIIGTFVCWHSRYSLGHEHDFDDTEELFKELASECNPSLFEEISEKYEDDTIAYDEYTSLLEDIVRNAEDVYILPLYLYDHSRITMNTTGFSCSWDSGQVGYVYTTKKELDRVGCGYCTAEEVEKLLVSEVKLYDTYLRGEVFGYSLVRCDEDGNECEEVDSCHGFYGRDIKESGMLDNMSGYLSEEERKEIFAPGTNVYDYLTE